MNREICEYRERCGKSGHFLDAQGNWQRCKCLRLEIAARRLGQFYCESPAEKTQLTDLYIQGIDLLVEGPLTAIRPHVARVLLDLAEANKTFTTMDAYRLIEVFLEKDEEFDNTYQCISGDLTVILLGFGDPRNRYLPELLLQAISRRELLRRPTWIVLGLNKNMLSTKYSVDLAEKLGTFKKVKIQ